MNIKRILFWIGFIVVIGLIIWGLIVASYKKTNGGGATKGTPMELTAADHVRGATTSVVTLIEYADYQCPACASFHPVVERLIREASTTMRFVSRHFPLPQHKNAVIAAQAAEAAGKQGKYWDMHEMLFDNQKSWETLTGTQATEVFKGYAERIGLNITQYETDFSSSVIKDKIEADRADGVKIGVVGTPTFFLNGKAISNPSSYAEFKKLIDDAAQAATN